MDKKNNEYNDIYSKNIRKQKVNKSKTTKTSKTNNNINKVTPLNKVNSNSKNTATRTYKPDTTRNKRIFWVLIVYSIAFIIILFSFARTQLVEGQELKEKARDQQLLKQRIGAKRGNILDRNGEILAQSVDVDTVGINPKLLRKRGSEPFNNEELADIFVSTFGLNKDEVLKKITSERNFETIIEKIEKHKVEELNKKLEEAKIVQGVVVNKDIKRNYPYSTVASHIIGFVNKDNVGQEGIERQLDEVLTGREGRMVSQSDVHRNLTKENPEQLIQAEDGKNVYLTIDVKMQSMVERYLKEAVKKNSAQDGIAVVMSPKTGEVLAMANEPTYDLNNPRQPINISQAEWDKLTTDQKMTVLYGGWKNKAVTDVYDPGSTFKLITAAMGIEEGVTDTDIAGDFYCAGVQVVYDREIKCWRSYNPHGALTLRGALENSCNPAFIQLAQRLGVSKFYKYLTGFGFLERTNIDLLGESNSVMHEEKNVGPVELATLSFGQRFQVTPIQLITGISALANEGKLIKPQVVYKVENQETKTQEIFQKQEIREVVSKETAAKIMEMMRSTVKDGTGRNADVAGYNVGGKSGTSEPVYGVKDSVYVASFVAVVPTEDPEYVVLMLLRDPKGQSIQGGQIVAPVVGQILREILTNSNLTTNITSNFATVDQSNIGTVKSITNKTIKEAKELITAEGLELVIDKDIKEDDTIIIQNPKPGTRLDKGSKVYITVAGKTPQTVVVPDLNKQPLQNAKRTLESLGLNVSFDNSKGVVMLQNPIAGMTVERGAVINLTIKEELREAH